jgi:hypothetical protein
MEERGAESWVDDVLVVIEFELQAQGLQARSADCEYGAVCFEAHKEHEL